MTEFLQKAEIIDNPMAVLAHLEAGTLSRTHVETLQFTSPELYEWMRQQLMRRVPGSNMAYQKRGQVATMLNLPGVEPTRQQWFIDSMRPQPQEEAPQKPGPKPGGQPGSNQSITVDERRASGATLVASA